MTIHLRPFVGFKLFFVLLLYTTPQQGNYRKQKIKTMQRGFFLSLLLFAALFHFGMLRFVIQSFFFLFCFFSYRGLFNIPRFNCCLGLSVPNPNFPTSVAARFALPCQGTDQYDPTPGNQCVQIPSTQQNSYLSSPIIITWGTGANPAYTSAYVLFTLFFPVTNLFFFFPLPQTSVCTVPKCSFGVNLSERPAHRQTDPLQLPHQLLFQLCPIHSDSVQLQLILDGEC